MTFGGTAATEWASPAPRPSTPATPPTQRHRGRRGPEQRPDRDYRRLLLFTPPPAAATTVPPGWWTRGRRILEAGSLSAPQHLPLTGAHDPVQGPLREPDDHGPTASGFLSFSAIPPRRAPSTSRRARPTPQRRGAPVPTARARWRSERRRAVRFILDVNEYFGLRYWRRSRRARTWWCRSPGCITATADVPTLIVALLARGRPAA